MQEYEGVKAKREEDALKQASVQKRESMRLSPWLKKTSPGAAADHKSSSTLSPDPSVTAESSHKSYHSTFMANIRRENALRKQHEQKRVDEQRRLIRRKQ
jgi:hypothetical protein